MDMSPRHGLCTVWFPKTNRFLSMQKLLPQWWRKKKKIPNNFESWIPHDFVLSQLKDFVTNLWQNKDNFTRIKENNSTVLSIHSPGQWFISVYFIVNLNNIYLPLPLQCRHSVSIASHVMTPEGDTRKNMIKQLMF